MIGKSNDDRRKKIEKKREFVSRERQSGCVYLERDREAVCVCFIKMLYCSSNIHTSIHDTINQDSKFVHETILGVSTDDVVRMISIELNSHVGCSGYSESFWHAC